MNYLNTAMLFISCLTDLYIISGFMDVYIHKKITFEQRRREVMLFVCSVIIWFLGNYFGSQKYNILFAFMICIGYSIIKYDDDLKKILSYMLTVFFILIAIETGIGLLINLQRESYKKLSNIPEIGFIVILVKYIVVQVLQRKGKSLKEPISIRLFCSYLLMLLSGLCIIVVMFYTYISTDLPGYNHVIIFMSFAFLLISDVVVFYIFNSYFQKQRIETDQKIIIEKKDRMLEYYKNEMERNSDRDKLVHDVNHFIVTIQVMADKKDYKSILGVTEKLVDRIKDIGVHRFCSSDTINMILSDKKSRAEREGIDIKIDVGNNLEFVKYSEIDLISVLGNLLDNAIRAAGECQLEKKIHLEIYRASRGNYVVVKISNTYSGEIKQKNDRFLTTKTDVGNHGIGLESVRSVASKYGGDVLIEFNEKYFITTVLL